MHRGVLGGDGRSLLLVCVKWWRAVLGGIGCDVEGGARGGVGGGVRAVARLWQKRIRGEELIWMLVAMRFILSGCRLSCAGAELGWEGGQGRVLRGVRFGASGGGGLGGGACGGFVQVGGRRYWACGGEREVVTWRGVG